MPLRCLTQLFLSWLMLGSVAFGDIDIQAYERDRERAMNRLAEMGLPFAIVGKTPGWERCMSVDQRIVKRMTLVTPRRNDFTPATLASFSRAIRASNLEAIKTYVMAGMPPDLEDGDGTPVLMLAIKQDQPRAAKLLWKLGAPPRSVNESALILALRKRATSGLRSDYDDLIHTLLHGVEDADSYYTADCMGWVSHADPFSSDDAGDTAVMIAAKLGDLAMLKLLIGNRDFVYLDDKNHEGQSALDYALANGHSELAQFLIQSGAAVSDEQRSLMSRERWLRVGAWGGVLLALGLGGGWWLRRRRGMPAPAFAQ